MPLSNNNKSTVFQLYVKAKDILLAVKRLLLVHLHPCGINLKTACETLNLERFKTQSISLVDGQLYRNSPF